jgi:LacI family transcriptional regulator
MTKKTPKTTLKMIAAQLGTTATTVSRVVSGQARKYRISRETEKRILSAAKEFDFTPNHIARSLRTHKTYTIGLVVPDIANPFFSTVAQIIESEARANN